MWYRYCKTIAIVVPFQVSLTSVFQTAHMSEEVKNAAKAVPRTMVIIYFLNFILL